MHATSTAREVIGNKELEQTCTCFIEKCAGPTGTLLYWGASSKRYKVLLFWYDLPSLLTTL